jgi:hypothetical protein
VSEREGARGKRRGRRWDERESWLAETVRSKKGASTEE